MATQQNASEFVILEVGRDPIDVDTYAFDKETAAGTATLAVERKWQAEVARGQVNQLNSRPPRGLYLFVADVEHAETSDDWVIHCEWIERQWMESVWTELRALKGGAEFQKIWQGRNWDKELTGLMEQYAGYFYRVFEWYLQRTVDADRGLPPAGLLKLRLPPDSSVAARFAIGEWYSVPPPLFAAPASDEEVWIAGDYTTTGLTYAEWLNVRPCWIAPPRRLAEAPDDGTASQGSMQMLHFIQADPFPTLQGVEIGFGRAGSSPASGGAEEKTAPSDTGTPAESGGSSQSRSTMGDRIRRAGRRAVQRLDSWLEEWTDWLRPPLVPAFAGGVYGPRVFAPRRPAPVRETRGTYAYIGYPAGGIVVPAPAGPLAQLANPMVIGAGQQPFVGILNVGEANCNVLYDRRGKAIVYFDLGLPIAANNSSEPVPQPSPCFCDDPLVVLSHWDEDHYAMGFQHAAAQALRWIVPQQTPRRGGVQPLQLIASIINGGGAVYVWTAGSPSHMRFPWGFLERSNGNGNTNRSGLNAYVCVADAGGNAQLGWVAAAAMIPCAGGTHIAGLGNVHGGAAAPTHRADAAAAAAAVPGPNARSEAIARAIAVSPAARAAGLPAVAVVGRMAAAAEAAAAAGANAGVITIAVSAAIDLVAAGVAVANVVTAAGNAAAAVTGVVFATNALAIAAAAGASGLGHAGRDQHVGEIAEGVVRHAAGPAALQLAQAAIAGAVTSAIAVPAAVIEAAVTAAIAAAAAAVGDEIVAAVTATGGIPARATVRAALGPVLTGTGPNDPAERYVLLTGDALYRFVAGQRVAAPPAVVALNAPHHGANQDGGDRVLTAEIPWAPATAEAQCGAAATAAFIANVPAAATAVAAAVALHMDTPRAPLVRMAAVAIHAARLGGDARVVTVAAGASSGTVATATPLQVAQGAVSAVGVVVARMPNATAAANILADGGFLAATAAFAGARAEIAAVAASIAGGALAAIPVMAGAAATASAAGAGATILVTAVVLSTEKARVVATAANSMLNPLAVALYPNAPIAWDAATFRAGALVALEATHRAAIFLEPNVTSSRTLFCTAAAFAADPTVRPHGIGSDCIVHAVATVMAGAAAGHGIGVRAVAAATSHAFHIAYEHAMHAAQDVLDAIGRSSAHMERHAMQTLATLANAAVAAVPAGGTDAVAAAAVSADGNVRGALSTFARAQTFSMAVLVALEARLTNLPANATSVAVAWAFDNLATAVTAPNIVAAAANALAQPVNAAGRIAQVLADAAGVAAAGGGMPLANAQQIVRLTFDVRNPGGGRSGLHEIAFQLRAFVGERQHLVTCVNRCGTAALHLETALTFLGQAAVSAVRHAAGATAAQLAAVLDTATLGGALSLPTTFVAKAVQITDAVVAAGPNYFAQLRAAADTAGASRAVVMAATWAGPFWDENVDDLPIVEAAAAEGVTVELAPVREGVGAAIAQLGASATVAADFPPITTASRKIAYSYGVKWNGHNAPFSHCHRAGRFDTGPADPLAEMKYRSHGWTDRLNTSTNAAQGKQPGVNGGHSALGWEVVGGGAAYEGPLRAGPAGTCPHCVTAAAGHPTAFIV
jgi:hypothetical protein